MFNPVHRPPRQTSRPAAKPFGNSRDRFVQNCIKLFSSRGPWSYIAETVSMDFLELFRGRLEEIEVYGTEKSKLGGFERM